MSGCSRNAGGGFQIKVLSPKENHIHQDFTQSYSSMDEESQVTIVLRTRSRIQAQERIRTIDQTLLITTFWRPKRGLTPITSSATNANIEYLIEMDTETAWYRGAGFVLIKGKTKHRELQVQLRSSTIDLYQYTTGFPVTFTKAKLEGKARAVRDPKQVEVLLAEFRGKCRRIKAN